MSTTETLVVVYFSIGVLLITIAIASNKKGGAKMDTLAPVGDDPIGAGLLIFVLMLWPIWLIIEMTKNDEKPSPERKPDAKR